MRKILFRGKRVDNCEWAYGYYTVCRVTEDHVIESKECNHVVIPGTVGQYTGLNDKNGKRIFEGDIVMKRTYHGKKPMKVVFSFGCFHCGFGGGSSTPSHPYTLYDGQIEVIGNIYDNPELLKEGK